MIIICTEHNFYEHKFLYWHIGICHLTLILTYLNVQLVSAAPKWPKEKKKKKQLMLV